MENVLLPNSRFGLQSDFLAASDGESTRTRLKREGRWQPHLAEQMMSGELGVAMRDRYLGNNLWLLLMWQAWRIEVLGERAGARSWDHPFWLPPWLGRQMWSLKRSQE